ncbi:TauD/TfdA family dioxygenase [Thermochromatium tepidum]|uniref:Taurine catabolism dioxygenase TauD n=1 Tax=Thermochromatium tepidum ATCC 43061 TaxID=316276 RepID=A0A6I6EHK4_THETI|nr:TauD/TfdA family dioxygenase [Thermochromatium tepidum]QGU32757.1 taurine catabolism dioxygenase TauD [Thermochromatium tepidum ATCC 43061]
MPDSAFALDDDSAYLRWRERKLEQTPTDLGALIVEVRDPRRLSDAERAAILERCRRANLAIYIGATGDDPDKEIPRALGASLGLHRLDHNPGADEDAITALTVQTDVRHRDYIPYSNLPISWHTDGYYNDAAHQIRGLVLHCVHPAAEGGANALLDHEIIYLLLRDQNPEFIRALMHPGCMIIPANRSQGEEIRPERAGPVFSVHPDGRLHMRYTHRTRNIRWRDDPITRAAVAALRSLLDQGTPWTLSARLESGWGLVCNNVLHTRTGFTDGPVPRLVYRARYYDRLQDT